MQKKDDSQDRLLNDLAQADFTHTARGRSALKARFLEGAQRAASRSSHPLRLAIEIVGLALLGFGFLFTVSSLVNNRPAAIPRTTEGSCETVNYVVADGDTLDGIAAHFAVLTQDIQDWNNVTQDKLYAGQVLKIPLCKRLPTSSPVSASMPPSAYPPANTAQANQNSCDTVDYTIKVGDTFNSIAAHYQVTAQAIQDWNNLTQDYLRVGQVIKIPLCKSLQNPGPTPQPSSSASGGINLDSPVDAVRIAISQPSWKTLWVEAEIDYAPFSADTNQPDKRLFSQAWLDKNRRGLILSTDFIRNSFDFNLDFGVNSVALLNGGRLDKYDHTSNQIFSSPVPDTTTLEPLAGISPALDLVFPGFLYILSSEPRPLRMETTLGRPALVADWGNSRLWVDSQTGLVLRAERYTGEVGNSPLDAVLFLRQVRVDPVLDDAVFNPPPLKELTFRPAPDVTQPSVTSTPFAETSADGWVYFQAAAQAPFEWKVYRMPAGCLIDGSQCPDPQQLPGNPNLQITGLYWTPDGSLAVFSDTNNNQIVAYDPATRQWPRVLQGFFQPQLIWSQDGSQIAALTEGVDPYDMRLVIITRDGWTLRDVPTVLKGEKQVYGWLDDHTLAVKVPDVTFKGTPPAWAATDLHPGIYRIDVNTGKADLLPISARNPYEMSLSPDGKRFVYWTWVNNEALLLLASAEGESNQIIGRGFNMPLWSPSGYWILSQAYTIVDKNQPTITSLFVMRPDASVVHKVLATTATVETAWSPDEQTLLVSEFDNAEAGSHSLSTFDVKTGTLKKLDLPAMTGLGVLNLLGWQK